MANLSSISVTFSNLLDSDFTLGKANDGFPPPTLSQDMAITRSVASPLTSVNQSVVVVQENTFLDAVKDVSMVTAVATNPSGSASFSVVWTNYTLGIRFGISASAETTRLDALGRTASSIVNIIPGVNVPAPSPTFNWSYLLDATPDQPGTWIAPTSLTAPQEPVCPGKPGYKLVITPTVDDYSLNVQCQIQSAD